MPKPKNPPTERRYDAGFIKLFRKVLTSFPADKQGARRLFMDLLLLASWKDADRPMPITWKGNDRKLLRGELWTTYDEMHFLSDQSRGAIYRNLGYLTKSRRIRAEGGTNGVVITILNYSRWQDEKEKLGRIGDESGTKPGCNRAHKKNSKKIKNTNSSEQAAIAARSEYPQKLSQKSIGWLSEVGISPGVACAAMALYDENAVFLDKEILRMILWVKSNPHKKPKSQWARFFNRWLAQGFEKTRKELPPNKPRPVLVQDSWYEERQ